MFQPQCEYIQEKYGSEHIVQLNVEFSLDQVQKFKNWWIFIMICKIIIEIKSKIKTGLSISTKNILPEKVI